MFAVRDTPLVSASRCRSAPWGPRSRARRAAARPPSGTAAPRPAAAGRPRPAAAGRRASRAAGGPRGCAGATPGRAPRRARAEAPSSGRAGAAPRSSSGSTWVRRSCQSCMRCSRVRRNRYAASRAAPSSRPTYPPWVRCASAESVVGARTASSERPCTSWSSWTANSTSRSPPEPSLICRPACAAGMWSTTRRRIACTSVTKPSRSDADHTIGATRAQNSRAQLEVAGDRPGLEQRLELPGLGPALVVALVARQRPDQRPGLALRAQRRVDRPDGALGGVVGADPHQVRGELGRGAQRRLLVAPLGRLGHEDHVDVADVVELVAAALAHRDHAEPGWSRRRHRPAPGRSRARRRASRPRGRTARRRRRRPRRRARGRGRRAGAAAGGTPPAARRRSRRRPARHRRGGPWGPPRRRASRPAAHREGGRAGRAEGRVAQVAPVLGVPQQVVAERRAGADDGEQPHRRALVVDEGRAGGLPVLDAVGQVGEELHRLVGVGGGADQRHQHLGAGAEPFQRTGRALDVLEAEPDQPTRGGADPSVAHRWARSRHPRGTPARTSRRAPARCCAAGRGRRPRRRRRRTRPRRAPPRRPGRGPPTAG